ncbi:MAG: peptidyl-prolyl cis-trans isomerase [Parvibaculales bacterium]
MRLIVKKIFREPIVLFLIISSALYVAYQNHQSRNNPDIILVNQESLETFIQYRQRRFDGETVSEKLASMTDEERQKLIQDYVLEEAMVREARMLKLDESDYIIRQRLIQKLEFLEEEKSIEIDEKVLHEWHATHQEKYIEPASISFEHVFFKIPANTNAAEEKTLKRAKQFQNAPNSNEKPDRFAYHNFYQKRDKELIQSHFGADFTQEIFALTALPKNWQGPIKSRFGYHLVKVLEKQEAKKLSYEQAEKLVRHDYRQEQKFIRRQKLAERYLKNYQLVIE